MKPMTICYDIQLPINHVISKTVLHPVAVCITSHNQKNAESLLNFSDLSIDKFLFLLVMKLENNNNKFHCMAFKWQMKLSWK